ncbi:hypothetical protein HK101_006708, partial [Irineochytrium annulatum]
MLSPFRRATSFLHQNQNQNQNQQLPPSHGLPQQPQQNSGQPPLSSPADVQQQPATNGSALISASAPRIVKQGWILKRAGSGFLSQWRLKYVVIMLVPSGRPPVPGGGGGMNMRPVLRLFDQCDQSRPAKHEVMLDECEVDVGEEGVESGGGDAGGGVGGIGKKPVAPFTVYARNRKFHFAGQSRHDTEDWLTLLLQHATARRASRRNHQNQTLRSSNPPQHRSTTSQDVLRQQQLSNGGPVPTLPDRGMTLGGSMGRAAGNVLNMMQGGGMNGGMGYGGMRRSNTLRSIDDDARSMRSMASFDDTASIASSVACSVVEHDDGRSVGGNTFETLSFCSEPILTPHELMMMGSSATPVNPREDSMRRRKAPMAMYPDRQVVRAAENWNERYQKLLSQRPDGQEAAMRLDVQIVEIIGAFEEAALNHAIHMVDEYHLKSSSTVAGAAATQRKEPGAIPTTIIDGIILHFACDYLGSTSDEVEFANAKAASELRSIDALNRTGSGLQTALMVLIDYKGFRVVAYADMGIDEKTKPLFDLSSNPPTTNEKASEKMSLAAHHLNLKPHGVQIGEDRRVNVHLGHQVQVHHDDRRRLSYAVNLHGILPMDFYPTDNASTPSSSPQRGSVQPTSPNGAHSHPPRPDSPPVSLADNDQPRETRRLRPELLRMMAASSTTPNTTSSSGYPGFPGLPLQVGAGPLSSDAFTVASGCGRRERSLNDAEATRAARFLREQWVPALVRRLDGMEVRPVDSITVATELHRAGVNVRYLGLIAKLSTIPYIQELACVEMVARACKSIFRSKLRGLILHFKSVGATQIDEETRNWTSNMFSTALGSAEKSQKFFEERIRPEIRIKYDYEMDYYYFRTLHRAAIFLSMQYQCGVVFDDGIDYAFNTANPCPRNRLVGFTAKRKKPNGLYVDLPPATVRITNHAHGMSAFNPSQQAAVTAGTMAEEIRQSYLLARHFRGLGPKAKLSPSEASSLRLTEVAAHYNASGRFEEARRHAAAAVSAAARNTCAAALARAQLIEALGAIQTIQAMQSPTPAPQQKPLAPPSFNPAVLSNPMAALQISPEEAHAMASIPAPLSSASSSATLISGSGSDDNANAGGPPGQRVDPAIINLHQAALSSLEWQWGPQTPMMMAVHDRMANVHLRSRRLSAALGHHSESLAIALSALGKTHPVTAGYLTRAGCLLSMMKQTDQAIARLTEALHVHTSLASSDVMVAEVHSLLAEALDARGDSDAAIDHAQRGRKLRERALGQHDARSVASYMQLARLVMKPYEGYTGVLTPAIRSAYREAISCYEKVFRFVKAGGGAGGPGSGVNGGSTTGSRAGWSSGASVYSMATTTADHTSILSSERAGAGGANITVTPPISGPGLVFPYGGPPPVLPRSILHKLTRQIVAMKLQLLESPRHKEVVRTLRASARA